MARTLIAATPMEDISYEQCVSYMRYSSYVGRLGFTLKGVPSIIPINYLFDNGSIFFKTLDGTTISGLQGQLVAFEVDDNRPLTHSGWSVVARGIVQPVEDPEELDRLERGPLQPWAWTKTDRAFRIDIAQITGKQVTGPLQLT